MARKEKMKVYHGLPKSITDKHTVFYSSFDGNINPRVGGLLRTPSISYTHSPTGYGVVTSDPLIYYLNLNEPTKYLSIDMLINLSGTGTVHFFKLQNDETNWVLGLYKSSTVANTLYMPINNEQSSQLVNVNLGNVWKDGLHFLRIILDIYNGKILIYQNGTLVKEVAVESSTLTNILSTKLVTVNTNSKTSASYISDLHISNIDRGSYFPNLPQDFIEGKAIIKPRMGQQQIKGDPMYSQVTRLKVPNQPYDVMGTIYSLEEDSDGLNTCFSNPELATASAYEWVSGVGKIRIRGLNGEIISGVIDTDTALARVTGYPDIRTVQVDDVSKIKVGDKFLVYYPQANNWLEGTTQRTVESIDTQNKTVTVTDHMGWNVDTTKGVAYILEVTTSSSSPTVKTQDGVEVTGTWSGLGTNSATFTMGSQSTSIVGKDLYVTYALTMPSGNSDFPQLPHIVERAYDENGIEMKPVTEIVIVDDFRGKISGSTKECPHISSYKASPSHIHPNDFSKDSFVDYNSIGYLDDSYNRLTNEQSGNVSRQLFSFNIIEMVERKFGVEIPGNNKVQWLKDNLDNYCKCTAYGYGSSTSPMYTISSWSIKDNSWTDNTAGATHSNNFISPVTFTSTVFTDRIDKKGFAHFVVFTKASDGANPSILFTDYVSLEIKLKIDSTFTTFYRENKRAREDKCNPVLIQKETKTVKRYLPSKEPFVTESLAYPNSVVTSSTTDVSCDKGLYKQPFIYITNYGTATTVDSNYLLGLQPIIPKLPLNPNFKEHQFVLGEIPIDRLQTLPKVEKSILVKVPTMMDALPNSSNQNKFYSEGKIRDIGEQLSKDLSMAVRFGIALVEKDGEMYMKIRSCVPNSPNYAKSTILSMSTNFDMEYLYKLPTRPLIK